MKNYLNDVKKHCFNLEKNGKIVPITLSYPIFKVTENDFRKQALEYVTERVKIGLITDSYNNSKFDIDYAGIFSAEERQDAGITNAEDARFIVYKDKILPTVMNRDSSLDAREIRINTVKDSCVSAMQTELLELESTRNNSLPFERNFQSSYSVDKDKFVASMMMLKHQLPYAYNAVNIAMNTSGMTTLVTELKDMEKHPHIGIIKIIYEHDQKFALEHYAPMVKKMLEFEEPINFNNKKQF